MPSTLERVPPYLRQFVAKQDYGAYDEIDQAVWRFIEAQMLAREDSREESCAEGGKSPELSGRRPRTWLRRGNNRPRPRWNES